MSWTPNYLAYCAANGSATAEEQLAKDRVRWPGGCMCGFILWIGAMKRGFRKAHPEAFLGPDSIVDRDAWLAWLADPESWKQAPIA